MRIVYLTAGAAGMYCGSCLHDNALAKALIKLGHDAILVPTYTPILTDEESVANDKLFFGGLNVYLQQLSAVFRWMPKWADSFLSSPRLVGWVASRAMGTSANNLGALTVSMLKGTDGKQVKEVHRLCDWLESLEPDVVVFSNLLIAGCIGELKRRLDCPVVVVLQGDDIFYDALPEPFRGEAAKELRRLAQQVDLFIVHSNDYGRRMQRLLDFDDRQLAINPLSIDTSDYASMVLPAAESTGPPTIGYLARLAPEKGLHQLVDAFVELKTDQARLSNRLISDLRLRIAGWLGPQHQEYWQQQQAKLDGAGLQGAYEYVGEVERNEKLEFLQSIDVLCVPTPYLEPKGLFVLEALAAGVPYVQPAHGAFPELHERLQGGYLYDPESVGALSARLAEVLSDLPAARLVGRTGRERVMIEASSQQEAERFVALLTELCN